MADTAQTQVTELLLQANAGAQEAVDALFEKVYAELPGTAKLWLHDQIGARE